MTISLLTLAMYYLIITVGFILIGLLEWVARGKFRQEYARFNGAVGLTVFLLFVLLWLPIFVMEMFAPGSANPIRSVIFKKGTYVPSSVLRRQA